MARIKFLYESPFSFKHTHIFCYIFYVNYQLLDEVEQNITICRWRADQLFADAEGRGK